MLRPAIWVLVALGVAGTGLFCLSLVRIVTVQHFRPTGMSWAAELDFGRLSIVAFHAPIPPKAPIFEGWLRDPNLEGSYTRDWHTLWHPSVIWAPQTNIIIDLPVGPLTLADVAAWGLLVALRRRRRSRQRLEERCARCDYDLRASSERCPECGTPRIHEVPPLGRYTCSRQAIFGAEAMGGKAALALTGLPVIGFVLTRFFC